ncbi:transmembrane adaptor Erv26-domain-containing protein [Cokeromyces recurvatus]|uniref:transmembrane adaptor Erv26-domain-containing protein n=1 Tax=Cokeromyces recurvatus TaxID=90255 RepID=UPI00221FF433|nr:transmembrane adaptor Erv26-domain-containing protein [Cokeromyces recurvatus]KAI7907294.1 transmembrane adaptor Erv26-domain-containing protein [Cokeromyces recurvatus]
MLSVLHLVAYAATGLAFCSVVLSLACGLYYLAELIEEYSVYTKKVIKTLTIIIISLHVLFWIFDRLPFFHLAFSIFCHCVYSLNLKTFPFISLTGLPFIGSCILVFADHFLWFKYFTTHYRPFMDIAAFFGLCVWLVPFAYFISLSANDNALPTSDPAFVDAIPHQHKQGLMKTLLSYIGVKTQDTTMLTTSAADFNSTTNTNIYNQPSMGVTSSIHYTPPRDIQNRKTL